VGKGGLLLAVEATLMPLFWDKVGVGVKMALVAALVLLFLVEYRAIDKEHAESAESQREELKKIGEGFQTVLDRQQSNFSTLIQTSQANFRALVEDEQKHFEKMMSANLRSQKEERDNFAKLLNKGEELLSKQEEFYEFSTGQLIPDNEPIPAICDPLSEREFLIAMGNSGYAIRTFPINILIVGGKSIIRADRSKSGALLLSINLETRDGRIIARINQNSSTINPTSGLLVSRTKSTLLLEDQFGHELINAKYLNARAFSITGTVPSPRGDVKLPVPILTGCERVGSVGHAVVDIE
jgi:hypothetical protein